ncbi:MAG: hypothetical protein MMC33_002105 [Icmadophila ericetorum]|nr:hypothetical protein [Icmadophila ericetorum]
MRFNFPWRKSPSEMYSSLQDTDSENDGAFPSEKRPKPVLISSPRLLYTLLAIFAFCLFGALFQIHVEIDRRPFSSKMLKSPIPDLPLEVKSFYRGVEYFVGPSEASDAAWKALAGPPREHQGFVWVDDYKQYNMKPGAQQDGKTIYGVAMFHQLHCLAELRNVFWDLVLQKVDPVEMLRMTPNDTSKNFQATGHGYWHAQHCFDYLRQSIQCTADMSLEWPIEADGKKLFVGWETPHVCKSWDAAWAYVDDNS